MLHLSTRHFCSESKLAHRQVYLPHNLAAHVCFAHNQWPTAGRRRDGRLQPALRLRALQQGDGVESGESQQGINVEPVPVSSSAKTSVWVPASKVSGHSSRGPASLAGFSGAALLTLATIGGYHDACKVVGCVPAQPCTRVNKGWGGLFAATMLDGCKPGPYQPLCYIHASHETEMLHLLGVTERGLEFTSIGRAVSFPAPLSSVFGIHYHMSFAATI